MGRYTPIANLPGEFAGFFESNKVICTWKGFPGYSILYYFAAPEPDDKKANCRLLLCLKRKQDVFNYAQALSAAKKAWVQYKEEILAGDEVRVEIEKR